MAGIMATDYLGLCPKPNKRIEGGGATGGLCFQAVGKRSPRADERLRGIRVRDDVPRPDVEGNEFIALASDVNFDYPVGDSTPVLRDDGEPAHARVRHNGRAARDGVGEEPYERLRKPVRTEATQADHRDVRNSAMVAYR